MGKELFSEFAPYEQSLELKELGFDEPCFGYYDAHLVSLKKQTPQFLFAKNSSGWLLDNNCASPTFSQAFRFFRNKYDYSHNITKTIGGEYIPYVNGYELDLDDNCEEVEGFKWIYKTYEEAELACLKKLIEIAKTKN